MFCRPGRLVCQKALSVDDLWLEKNPRTSQEIGKLEAIVRRLTQTCCRSRLTGGQIDIMEHRLYRGERVLGRCGSLLEGTLWTALLGRAPSFGRRFPSHAFHIGVEAAKTSSVLIHFGTLLLRMSELAHASRRMMGRTFLFLHVAHPFLDLTGRFWEALEVSRALSARSDAIAAI